MARDFFQECESAIEADLAEVSGILDFVTSSFRIYSKSGNVLERVNDDSELRELFIQFRERKLDELNVLYQSLFIQAWASFESFVRKIPIAYLDEFVSRKDDFESLEKCNLARRNLQYTGEALQHIFENKPGLSLDFFLLAKNASTSVSGSAKVILNSTAFTIFLAGPGPEGLKEALKRVGIQLNWDQLGRIADWPAPGSVDSILS
jgi:hypothetical protein